MPHVRRVDFQRSINLTIQREAFEELVRRAQLQIASRADHYMLAYMLAGTLWLVS